MNNFWLQLQQIEAVIVFWTQKADAILNGQAESPNIKFDSQSLTVLIIKEDQRRLLRTFEDSKGAIVDGLRIICSLLGERLEQFASEASVGELSENEALLNEVYGDWEKLSLTLA